MTIEEAVLEKVKGLPNDKKQAVLDFTEFLESKELKKQPRQSLYGVLSDLDVNLTEEDIAEARKEMWGNFPREHFFDEEPK